MYLLWGNLHKFLFNLAGKFLMIMVDQIGLTYNRIMELQGLLFIDILLLKVFEKKVLINPLETIWQDKWWLKATDIYPEISIMKVWLSGSRQSW